MEADIGENVTLAIIPVDGTVETRTYTIVGFLAEQSEALLDESWGHGPNRYPVASILVSAPGACFCHRAHRDSPTGGTASRHDTRTLPQ